jgi:hypothetical protein
VQHTATPVEKRQAVADQHAALKAQIVAGGAITVEQLDRLGDAYDAALNAL